MPRTIALDKQAQQTGTSYGQMGFRMVITATGTNVTSAVFRYFRRPVDPASPSGAAVDDFEGVCWPEELASLPLNNPASGSDPWFRLAALDLIFRSEDEASSFWASLQGDVRALLDALKKMDTLGPPETFTYTA